MKKIIYPLILSAMISLIVTSCGLLPGGGESDSNLPAIQATMTLSATDKVGIELTTQYDTAVVYNAVNQIVKFKYNVKMIRNDLTDSTPPNLVITISTGGTAVCPAINTVGNLNDRLDTGEIIQCTFDYPILQTDLDKGSITNVATANIYGVNSIQVTTTVPAVSSKVVTLTKSANPTTYSAAGQTITYTYIIKNSGTSPIGPSQCTITDTGINNNAPFNCGNADATIAPGATLTCSSTYTVSAADANAASVSSNAVATCGGASPSQPASAPITKGAAVPGSGNTVQHTVRNGEWLWQIARCYGADPQKTVEANPSVDPKMLKAGMVVNVPNVGSKGTIFIKSASDLCVRLHTVQSGETWTSIAQLYGADPGLTQMSNSNNLIVGKEVKVPLYTAGLNIPLVTTPSTSNPTSALVLTVTPSTTTYGQAGQAITFNYAIKNNGTTTLGPTQFIVNDVFMSPSAFNCGPASTTLAPGATTTCSNNYSISQNDMGAVNIQFSTTASGSGVPTSPAVATTLTKGITQLTLTVTANPLTYSQAGQIINFSYTIKNSGTTTLGPAQFTVIDPFLNPTTINCGVANTTLTPNATVNCSATYTISQVDMGAVNIQFSTTASGGGAPTSQAVPTTITKQ